MEQELKVALASSLEAEQIKVVQVSREEEQQREVAQLAAPLAERVEAVAQGNEGMALRLWLSAQPFLEFQVAPGAALQVVVR